MDNLPGNPYGTRSAVADDLTEHDGHWGISQAAMALAFEQRTANLIAYLERVDASLAEAIPTADLPNIRRAVHEQIAARLGLWEATQ